MLFCKNGIANTKHLVKPVKSNVYILLKSHTPILVITKNNKEESSVNETVFEIFKRSLFNNLPSKITNNIEPYVNKMVLWNMSKLFK